MRLEKYDLRSSILEGRLSEIGATGVTVGEGQRTNLGPLRHMLAEQTAAEPFIRACQTSEMVAPSYFMTTVDNVKLLGHDLFVVGDKIFHQKLFEELRHWSIESLGGDLTVNAQGDIWWTASKVQKQVYAGTSLVIHFHGGNNNYHHWLIDSLPILDVLSHCGQIENFIVSEKTHSRLIDIAQYFGLDKAKVKTFRPDETGYVYFDRLVFPSPLSVLNSWVRPELVSFLRNVIPSANHVHRGPLARFIYLSRLDTQPGPRTLVNEDEVASTLHDEGFTIIRMSDHNFLEQVAIVNSADVVVGLHGAAAANIVFAKRGAHLLLLEHEFKGYTFYRHICTLVGVSYSVVSGSTFLNPGNPLHWQSHNWVIDPEKVRRVVRSLVEESRKN